MPLSIFKESSSRRTPEPQSSAGARPPPVQPPLRPLMLVTRQQALALDHAARRDDAVKKATSAGFVPEVEPPRRRPPPQQFTAAPLLGRRVVGPPGPPPTCPLPPHPPRSPTSVTYNVNDRIERARALRARDEACARPPVAAVQRGMAPPPPPSELPYLTRAETADQRHQRAIEALKAHGSELPNVLRQIERGQPVMVPPRRSSLEASKKLPLFK